MTTPARRKDYGDFQTPPALVDEILGVLARDRGPFARVLEPTCGLGHFIAGLFRRPDSPCEVVGFEVQAEHAEAARLLVGDSTGPRVRIETADLFRVDLGRDLSWSVGGSLLVVGNLPWVTTSALGTSGGRNGPDRSNARGRRGFDAMTGESNFDISEALWLKLIVELAGERPTFALLCKTGVARAVLRRVEPDELPIARAEIRKIDAPRWFGASVDACLLVVDVGPGPRATEAPVFESLESWEFGSTFGFGANRPVADVLAYGTFAFADGRCPLDWRQGVKHDASPVMEIVHEEDGDLRNKLGEPVNVEPDYLFPLLKATDLAGPKRPRLRRSVIVTQRTLGEDTRGLEARAPRLWAYLQRPSSPVRREEVVDLSRTSSIRDVRRRRLLVCPVQGRNLRPPQDTEVLDGRDGRRSPVDDRRHRLFPPLPDR